MPKISSQLGVIALDILKLGLQIADERAAKDNGEKWKRVSDVLGQILPLFEQGRVFASPFDPSKVAWYEGGHLKSARLSRWIQKEFSGQEEAILAMASTVYGEAAKSIIAHYKVQLFQGDDIPDVYSSFDEIEGLRSCMTGSGGKLVRVYAKNPGRVSLAVVVDKKGSPLARALFWKAQTTEGQEVEVLDRVYYSELGARHFLKTWALARGAYVKEYDDHLVGEGRPLVSANGTLTKLHVILHADEDEIWPYMDTFRYMQPIEGQRYLLSTYEPEGYYYTLDDSDGFQNSADYYCRECGEAIHSDEEVYWYNGEPYCKYCFESYFFYCEECGHAHPQGDAFSVDDMFLCEDCFNEHYFYCDQCGEPFPLEDGYSVDGEMYCEECFDENFSYCVVCDRHYPSEYVHSFDGEGYCERCFEENFFYCHGCGVPNPREDGHAVDDDIYCEACFQEHFPATSPQ